MPAGGYAEYARQTGYAEGGGAQRQQRESGRTRHETGKRQRRGDYLGGGQYAGAPITRGKDLLPEAFVFLHAARQQPIANRPQRMKITISRVGRRRCSFPRRRRQFPRRNGLECRNGESQGGDARRRHGGAGRVELPFRSVRNARWRPTWLQWPKAFSRTFSGSPRRSRAASAISSASDANMKHRLAMLEERLTELEKKLNLPPTRVR